jgi:hypothetical protein
VNFGGKKLQTGDGIAVSEEVNPQVELAADGEVLWFDLPGYTH